jgi:metal-dependent amidase/aminoacylase/carboxypeptidase family protein
MKTNVFFKSVFISDLILGFAELGMREFKSSSILIKTLQEEGFTVQKGVTGMPSHLFILPAALAVGV